MARSIFFAFLLSAGIVLALAFPQPQDGGDAEAATPAATEGSSGGAEAATTPATGGQPGFSPEQCKQYQEQCKNNQNNLNQVNQVNQTVNPDAAAPMANMTNNTPFTNMTNVPNQNNIPNQSNIPAGQVPEFCQTAGIAQYCDMMNQQQQIGNIQGMFPGNATNVVNQNQMNNMTQINNFQNVVPTPMATPMPIPIGK